MDCTRYFRRTRSGNYFGYVDGAPTTVFLAKTGRWGFFCDGQRGDTWCETSGEAMDAAVRFAMEPRIPPCFAYFGLRPPISRDELMSRYRELAVQTHPDRGGTAGAFKTVQSNFEAALGCLEGSR